MNRQELFGIVQEMKPANLSLYYPDGESDVFGNKPYYPRH